MSELIWVPILTYSIIRYQQLNVRAIVTEVLAIALAAIFFINIFVDVPFGLVARIITFMVSIVMAYFLIRGVLVEDRQRRELDELNAHLNDLVAQKTAEIRRSYDSERASRLDLEKLNEAKDQFIMITQHHLRAPASIIAATLDAPEPSPEAVSTARASARRLNRLIDEFVSITDLRSGSGILSRRMITLEAAMDDVLDEFSSSARTRNITIVCPRGRAAWPLVYADEVKIRETFSIILDNALKYNRDYGEIRIATATTTDVARAPSVTSFIITITNTGIGLSPEEAARIGKALFFRGQEARKCHATGMGIGISVARAVIRAHGGALEIVSAGPGQGASVTIILPLSENGAVNTMKNTVNGAVTNVSVQA